MPWVLQSHKDLIQNHLLGCFPHPGVLLGPPLLPGPWALIPGPPPLPGPSAPTSGSSLVLPLPAPSALTSPRWVGSVSPELTILPEAAAPAALLTGVLRVVLEELGPQPLRLL